MTPASAQSSSAHQPPGQARTSLRYAWYVVIVLTALYMLSFVDRTILSLLVGSIKRDLGISDTRIGLLQGLSFALFYTIMGLPLGRMADTRSRRNLIAAGVVVWSLFTSACSFAKSFWSLFFTRIGVGVGEAGLSPAAYSLISDYFPPDRLGVAISVYYMGVFLGSSLALLVGGVVVDTMARIHTVTLPLLGTIASWRVTFLIVGLPGLLCALLVYTIKEPLRLNMLRSAQGRSRETELRPVPRATADSLAIRRRHFARDGFSVHGQLRAGFVGPHLFFARAWLDARPIRQGAGGDSSLRRLRRHVHRRPAQRSLAAPRPGRSADASDGAGRHRNHSFIARRNTAQRRPLDAGAAVCGCFLPGTRQVVTDTMSRGIFSLRGPLLIRVNDRHVCNALGMGRPAGLPVSHS